MTEDETVWAYDSEAQEPNQRRLGVAALIASLVLCFPFAAFLAVRVLRRSTDGPNRAMALAALVISAATTVGVGYVVLAEGPGEENEDKRIVSAMLPGACLNIPDAGRPGPGEQAAVVDCDHPHDAQVLTLVVLQEKDLGEDAENAFGDLCAARIGGDPDLVAIARRPELTSYYMWDDQIPIAGDKVACLVMSTDGDKLTEPLFAA